MRASRLPKGRSRLAAVLQAAGDVVRLDDASRALDMPTEKAAKQLSQWAGQGWLRRVGPGIYIPVPVEHQELDIVLPDPWVLVPHLFSPAYIGGRTAVEHWGLSEQIFRDTMVFTARPIRAKTVERQHTVFALKRIGEKMIFGTKTLWRGSTRVAISDIDRTMVDILDDPSVGGGIQHVGDCFAEYMKHGDSNPARLLEYAERRRNGAVFKRLGFLAERHPDAGFLEEAARGRLTKGHALLDPALKCDRLATRWRLRIPESWIQGPFDVGPFDD